MTAQNQRSRRFLVAAAALALLGARASAGITVSAVLDPDPTWPTWDRYHFWLSGFTGTDLTYTYSPPNGVSLPQHAENNQVNSIQGTFTVSPGGQISVPGDINYTDGGAQVLHWQDLTNSGFPVPAAAFQSPNPPIPNPRSTAQFTSIASLNFSRSPNDGTPSTLTGTWFSFPGSANSNFKTPSGTYTNGPLTLGNDLQSAGSALFEVYVLKGSVVRFNGLYNSYAANNAPTSFSVPNTWDAEGGGDTNWNTAANWGDNNVPAPGANVSFMLAGSQASLSVPLSAGTITLNRGDVFTISGSTLTLNSGITATNGNGYLISAPISLGGANAWNIDTGSVVSISGGVSGSATITKTGAGIVDLGGTNASLSGNLQINQGTFRVSGSALNLGDVDGAGTLSLLTGAATTANHYRTGVLDLQGTSVATVKTNGGNPGTSKVDTLTMAAGAKLNLNDNDLVVNTGVLATVKASIISGYAGGAWNGPGVMSSQLQLVANNDKALGYASGSDAAIAALGGSLTGQTFASTAVLVKYTYKSDANLDGVVNLADLITLAANFNQPGTKNWVNGDTNYDSAVNLADLISLAANWQKGNPTPLGLSFADAMAQTPEFENFTVVPEPASGAILMLAAGLLVRRRRVR